jgi:hypothetical protein
VEAQNWSRGGSVDQKSLIGITLMWSSIRFQIHIKMKSRIRIHIKVKRGIRIGCASTQCELATLLLFYSTVSLFTIRFTILSMNTFLTLQGWFPCVREKILSELKSKYSSSDMIETEANRYVLYILSCNFFNGEINIVPVF